MYSKTDIAKITEIDVRKLCDDNEFEIVNRNEIKIWNTIKKPAINRTGLELSGFFYNNKINENIIGWGTTESKFMDSISDKELKEKISKIFLHKPPLVICSSGVRQRNIDIILEQGNVHEVPIVLLDKQLSFVTATIGIYIAEKFSSGEFIHGSLVVINGIGILLIGDSGIGKSEAVLELVQKGHIFVSDDSVIIKRIGTEFIGFSPEITKNILEARGLGLIDIKFIYGDHIIRKKANINLVVELKRSEDGDNLHFDRIGNEKKHFHILGGKINKVIIPVRTGRNAASLIEAAAFLFNSKQDGVDALRTIEERIKTK